MALTIDGKSAKDSYDYPDWTGSEDKKMFKTVTLKSGVIIMGSKTYDTIGKPLPGRKNYVMTRDKNRKSTHQNLVYTQLKPARLLSHLEQQGYSEIILIGGATINTLFAVQGLIDEIYITYCPITFGTGLSLFSEAIDIRVELMDIQRLDKNSIFARYKVKKDQKS